MVGEVTEAKEEISRAFIAKHGYDADEACIVIQKDKWFIVRLDPEEVKAERRKWILNKIKQARFTARQRLFLALAGL